MKSPKMELFKRKVIAYNYEEFISNRLQFLFITGICGVGKTTLAKKLGEKCNLNVIETDQIRRDIKNCLYEDSTLNDQNNFLLKKL